MQVQAVVPLKSLAQAKSRLAGRLSPGQRRRLVREMLGRVLHTLLACSAENDLTAVALLSNDAEARELARELGATVLPDHAGTLNGALESARAVLTARAVTAMLIVPGDVPLITMADVRALIDPLVAGADVVLATDAEGYGTNALGLRLPSPLPLSFGVNSALLHRYGAARLHLRLHEHHSATLALDVDTAENLERYRERVPATRQFGGCVLDQ